MRDPRRVAVVLPMEESHGRAVVRGLLRYISMHSPWQLHIEPRWSSPEAIVRIRMAISTWHADGVIAHLALKPLQGELLATAIPLVNTSGGAALPADVPTVKPDQRAVGRIAADYFVQKGYRHFGYVGDPYLSLSAEQM